MDTSSQPGPWGPLARVVLYAAGLLTLGYVVLHALPYPKDGLALFGEYGRLEWVQVGLLAVCLGLSVLTAIQRPESRPLSILLAGGVVSVLVREHNNYFKDHHFSGLWELIVLAVLAATVLVAWRWRGNLVPALRRLVTLPAFGWLCAALILTAFAQLLDEQPLWELVLGREDVPYAARRVGEEAVETAAFFLFLVGLIEYRLGVR